MSRRGAALNVGRVQTPALFQSARSTRNATRLEKLMSAGFVLSIHAPRAERDRLDAAYKAARNEKADKEQWERYKKLLGRGNVPVTLEKFQEIKYTDIASWDEQKALYREVSWQKRAREKTVKGSAHSVPRSGEPDSVYDHSVGGRVRQRRYFGSTGKPMLDIDLTDHGNPKAHKPRHAHDFIEREDGSLARTDPGGRELTRAERIANEDILKGR